MENYNTWKMIKAGFWLGIGFIIPSIIVYLVGTVAIYKVVPYLATFNSTEIPDENYEEIDDYVSKYDKTSQMELVSYKENNSNGQLLIIGKVKNIGDSLVSSVQIEAELLDNEGSMVYECSEYITSNINKGEVENFQIKCGCGKDPIPKYKTMNVRITKASTY